MIYAAHRHRRPRLVELATPQPHLHLVAHPERAHHRAEIGIERGKARGELHRAWRLAAAGGVVEEDLRFP